MVYLDCKCVEFVIAGWSLHDLKLEQAMRNITCGDQQILVMVIRLVLMRVETEEISY